MTTIDPRTPTHEQATKMETAVRKQISALPSTMGAGHQALEALSLYRSARMPVPDDVLRKIEECYRHFTEGKPVAGRVAVEYATPAPLSLGEAFGVPDIKGGEKSALKRKRLAMAGPRLVALFTGQGVSKLSRTSEGYEAAANRLGLTANEVEAWVTKHLVVPRIKKPLP